MFIGKFTFSYKHFLSFKVEIFREALNGIMLMGDGGWGRGINGIKHGINHYFCCNHLQMMILSYTANFRNFSSCDSDIFSANASIDVNWSVKFPLPSACHILRFHSALSNILLIDILVNLQP